MSRPDYVRCVLTGRYDIPSDAPGGPHREEKTWCGRDVSTGWGWCFIDASHAALNAANGGRLVACDACVDAIVKALGRSP